MSPRSGIKLLQLRLDSSYFIKALLGVFKQKTYSLFLQVNRYRIKINNTDSHIYAVSTITD